METWRFLVSMCVLLLVWALVVTALGNPPTPLGLMVAVVFAAIGLYVSEYLVQRFGEQRPE